jgi:hypothetical protein
MLGDAMEGFPCDLIIEINVNTHLNKVQQRMYWEMLRVTYAHAQSYTAPALVLAMSPLCFSQAC